MKDANRASGSTLGRAPHPEPDTTGFAGVAYCRWFAFGGRLPPGERVVPRCLARPALAFLVQ